MIRNIRCLRLVTAFVHQDGLSETIACVLVPGADAIRNPKREECCSLLWSSVVSLLSWGRSHIGHRYNAGGEELYLLEYNLGLLCLWEQFADCDVTGVGRKM